MKETSDNEIDVDIDGESDNIDMGPSTQANENASKKLQLAELPKEMLEEILIHLDDENLLNASHVCKLFASVAESAFARKYSKKWYSIGNAYKKSFYKVMLNKYGGKIRKIVIKHCKDGEILELVEQQCVNVRSLMLHNVSRIVMMKDLKNADFGLLCDLKQEALTEFININPQLETLKIKLVIADLLAVGRLNNLKELQMDVADTADCIRHLQALTCNQVKELALAKHSNSQEDNDDLDDDFITEICKFKSVVSLDLPLDCITSDRVKKLAANLPHLTKLVVGIPDADSDDLETILSTTSMLQKLTNLTIRLNVVDFDRLSKELKRSANDFHARFAKSNTEIKLTRSSDKISITTDYLFVTQWYRSSELHWMDNLDEENVQKVLRSSVYYHAEDFKFVNNCADCTFDIATLAHKHTKYLDFKSNGPIGTKSNVLRYQEWFPQLKILKIHLERHSANDFLRNLEANFCEQIEELWLNTKGDTEDSDLPNVLAKFGNMKSLYLGPSPIKFDLSHLFLVCRNLKEIKHTRVLCLNEGQ